MAEALPANIGSKSAILLQWGAVDQKFQVEGVVPTNFTLLVFKSIFGGIRRNTSERFERRRQTVSALLTGTRAVLLQF